MEAHAAGHGAIAAVSQAMDIAVSTIGRGLKGLAGQVALAPGRSCQADGENPVSATRDYR